VGRKSKVPFGPFMLAGALLAILFGQNVFTAYLDVFGL
jgi:leader peptidase (prepilin peptidase)/N-methyltransferase